jgi:hypothetical protein
MHISSISVEPKLQKQSRSHHLRSAAPLIAYRLVLVVMIMHILGVAKLDEN